MIRATIRITRNFIRNLEDIETFLRETEAASAFESLLDDLFEQIIPSLEQFPDLGSDFFRHQPSSKEAADLATNLRERLGPATTLRELVRGDYLLLYARRGDTLYLLAIKHHRQLSFDFPDQWQD